MQCSVLQCVGFSAKQHVAAHCSMLVPVHSVQECVTVCCSVLQRFAVCYSVLQQTNFAEVCGSMLQRVAVCCSVLQCVAVCCSVLQRVAANTPCRSAWQCGAVCCSVLQCAAVCCSTLQQTHLAASRWQHVDFGIAVHSSQTPQICLI